MISVFCFLSLYGQLFPGIYSFEWLPNRAPMGTGGSVGSGGDPVPGICSHRPARWAPCDIPFSDRTTCSFRSSNVSVRSPLDMQHPGILEGDRLASLRLSEPDSAH